MVSPIMLAIETSQRKGGVALCDREGRIHEELLNEPSRHDDDLLPAIDRLVRRGGLSPKDLDAVAVSTGPGGFTGLRIAVSTAQMMAEALNVQLLAVPSANVAAHDVQAAGRALVALACKKNSFWAALFDRIDDHVVPVGQGHLISEGDMWPDDVQYVITDEHLPQFAQTFVEHQGIRRHPLTLSARHCLAVGRNMLDAGQVCESNGLAPLYPRPPEAAILWKQRR